MKRTLIYIIGAARSGTTLLDIVLGNSNNAISLGEINRFFKRNGIPPKRSKHNKVFVFWKNIRLKIEDNLVNINYEELDNTFNRNEYHSRFFKSVFKRNDKNYIETLRVKYKILTNNIQENLLIESSKYPVRALNISNYVNGSLFEIKYVFIRKDPVKVVASFRKKNLEQPAKGFLAANIYYLTVNFLCFITMTLLKKRGHKVFSFKHEDFLDNPEKTLIELSSKLDIDLKQILNKIYNNTALNTGFLFDGNRIRLKETLFLQIQKEKEKKDYKYYFIRIFNYIVYR